MTKTIICALIPSLLLASSSVLASVSGGKRNERSRPGTSPRETIIPPPLLRSSDLDMTTPASERPVRLEAFGFESSGDGKAPLSSAADAAANDTVANATSGLAKSQVRRTRCVCRCRIPPGMEEEDVQKLIDGTNDFFDPDYHWSPEPEVLLVNGSHLMRLFSEAHNPNVTNRSGLAACHLVMFYAPWCPFSAAAAPEFNALARFFPDITLLAVDSSKHQGINTQFGILALPTIIIFHNTKPILKFNHTKYRLDLFASFVESHTTSERTTAKVALRDSDRQGPLPSVVTVETDYYLGLAWLFTIVCAVGYFGKSSLCARIAETVRNNWREAEIQHEHID